MVFQSLLCNPSFSLSSRASSSSFRSGAASLCAKEPAKAYEVSAWRTFDRLHANELNQASAETIQSAPKQATPSLMTTGRSTWEKYFQDAERRCTEELCDWQVLWKTNTQCLLQCYQYRTIKYHRLIRLTATLMMDFGEGKVRCTTHQSPLHSPSVATICCLSTCMFFFSFRCYVQIIYVRPLQLL
mmetsp:Transcript_68643/g.183203  ORF Transcript_68643/g.183203 Transcript_68643/m.183203 type:complete len:186 (-) Transcript_68643:275-832(-)